MSKIKVVIDLDNGHSIAFKSDLGTEATPFEIVGALDEFIFPSVVRALGLRTSEDEAALNAEAVDRANGILAAAAENATANATESGTPYSPADLGLIDPETATEDELAGIPIEHLRSLDASQLSEAAKDKVRAAEDAEWRAHLAREDAVDAAAVAPLNKPAEELEIDPNASYYDADDVEVGVSPEGETRIQPKPGARSKPRPGRTAKK